MKRKGFISIFALLMLTVTLISSTYMMYIFTIQSNITRNSKKNIQSRISSEDNMNRLIFDIDNFEELILPELYYLLRNKNPPYKNALNKDDNPVSRKITIPSDFQMSSKIISANLRLEGSPTMLQAQSIPANFHEKSTIILNLETESEGVKNMVEAKGRVINEIFEIEEPYISEDNMIDANLLDEFQDLMGLIQDDIFDHDPMGSSLAINMNFDGDVLIDENYITGLLHNRSNFYGYSGRHVFINVKDLSDLKPNIEIKHQTNPDKIIEIKGNIYCEGNLIVSSPLILEGNLILNHGSLIVDTEHKPIIKGKVLHKGNGEFNLDDISLVSEKRYIYRYGSYIPGFLNIEINVIKQKI